MKIKKQSNKVLDRLAAVLMRGMQLADLDGNCNNFAEECFLTLAEVTATLEELAHRQRYKKVRK